MSFRASDTGKKLLLTGFSAVALTVVGIFLPERGWRMTLALPMLALAASGLTQVWRIPQGRSAGMLDLELAAVTLGMVGLLCAFVLLIA